MNASLRLCRRHALHPMRARLELELRVNAVAGDAADDFLVAAVLSLAGRQDLDAPASILGVFRIHAKQVAREDRGLVAAGPRPNLEINIAVVERVGRNQRFLQVEQQLLALLLERRELLLAHLPDFLVRIGRHFLGGYDVIENALVALERLHDRLDARVFPGEIAKLVLVGDDIRIGK